MAFLLRDVRSQGQSRKHVLALSFSGFDPERTSGQSAIPVEIVSQITLLRRLPAIFAGVGYLITAPPSAVIGD